MMLHQIGHYVAFASIDVEIETLVWGFGPKIASTEVANVELRLNAIPLGGYTKPSEDGNASLQHKSTAQQLWVYTAGIITNAVIMLGLMVIFCRWLRHQTRKTGQSFYYPTLFSIVVAAGIYANGALFVYSLFVPLANSDGWRIWGTILLSRTPLSSAHWLWVGTWGWIFAALFVTPLFSKPFFWPARKIGIMRQ